MHDTVTKLRRVIRTGEPVAGVAETASESFQASGLSRALAEPLSGQTENAYRDALHWTQCSQELLSLPEGTSPRALFVEILRASTHLREILGDMHSFLERAEDLLSERDDITFKESPYEREVAPFSRIDATLGLRDFLAKHPEFGETAASQGAQVEGDLMKIVYLEKRLREDPPKPPDLYAMIVELELDVRRHLLPAFEGDSPLMNALAKASEE